MARTSKGALGSVVTGMSTEQQIKSLLLQGYDNDTVLYLCQQRKDHIATVQDKDKRTRMADKFGMPTPPWDKIAHQRLLEQIRKCKTQVKGEVETFDLIESLKETDGTAQNISKIPIRTIPRISTRIPELDQLLGSNEDGEFGLPRGAMVILAAEKKTGKTRTSVDIAGRISLEEKVLYVQNEESLTVFRSRYAQSWTRKNNILLSESDRLSQLLSELNKHRPAVCFIDSFQEISETSSVSGGTTALKAFKAVCTDIGCALILISHMNSKGNLKGNTYLAHKADILLMGRKVKMHNDQFTIEAEGNRYGPSGGKAFFRHTEAGVVCINAERNKEYAMIHGRTPTLANLAQPDHNGTLVLGRPLGTSTAAGDYADED